jgi:AbiU2
MSEPKTIIDEFCTVCTSVRNDFDLYRSLFETNQRVLDLFSSVAPLCFSDLCRILQENLHIQFCKITDPARTGKKANLTTNYIVEEIPWPDTVARQLREVNEYLMSFRKLIEPARSKRIAHMDLPAQVERQPSLGSFPPGADIKFVQDLQWFIDIAYGHLNQGEHRPIAVALSTDTHQLVRALEKSILFDRCCKCTSGERAAAILDCGDHSA